MNMTDVAIIGAGPYGLSLAAHLAAANVNVRVFGQPMHFWRTSMPEGMVLKSEGFASNLWHPDGALTLRDFCAERGLVAFHDIHLDFLHARGIQTPCDSGEVYQFWDEVKAGRKFHEFVEDPREEMDGFGIGVIER